MLPWKPAIGKPGLDFGPVSRGILETGWLAGWLAVGKWLHIIVPSAEQRVNAMGIVRRVLAFEQIENVAAIAALVQARMGRAEGEVDDLLRVDVVAHARRGCIQVRPRATPGGHTL